MSPTSSIIITGAGGSLGANIATQLTEHYPGQFHLVLAARNVSNANAAELSARLEASKASFSWEALDLASLDTVADFVRRIEKAITSKTIPRLYALINSAAVQLLPITKTIDGFEIEYQTNVLAPILLIQKLQPLLKHGVVVNVSSSTHGMGKYDHFHKAQQTLDAEIGKVSGTSDGLQVYGSGKLALMMAGYALARKAEYATMRIIAADPGGMSGPSRLTDNKPFLLKIIYNITLLLAPLLRIFFPSALNPPDVPAKAIAGIVNEASKKSSAFYVLEKPKVSAAISHDVEKQDELLQWINEDLKKWV